MARTLENVWEDIHYDVHLSQHAGEYLSAGMQPNPSKDFTKYLGWINGVTKNNGLDTKQVNTLILDFSKEASKHGLPDFVINKLIDRLQEAARINGTAVSPPDSRDEKAIYDTIRDSLIECTGYGNRKTYEDITLNPAFVHYGKLIEHLKGGGNLTLVQLDQLIGFPGKVRNDPAFRGNVGSNFLVDFDAKIVPDLQKLKAKASPYSKKEDDVAEAMNQFYRKHGQALDSICGHYTASKLHPVVSPNLKKLLDAAQALNGASSWADYDTDKVKLRALLDDVIASKISLQGHIRSEPIFDGEKLITNAKNAMPLQTTPLLAQEYGILVNAAQDYGTADIKIKLAEAHSLVRTLPKKSNNGPLGTPPTLP